MRVVSVVGYQDAGKTTLVERLVPVLAERGRVATVKSIHHDVEVDTPGKDTYRHREAGAETVVGITPSTTFQITRRGKADGVDIEAILADLASDGYDFVIVEGLKEYSLPAIAVGDIEDEAIGGNVIARVPNGEDADTQALATAVEAIPQHE